MVEKPARVTKEKNGSPSKKTPEILAAIEEWIEENTSITLVRLCELVEQYFNIKIAVNTMKNWLDGMLYIVKNVTSVVININLRINKQKRSDYVSKLFDARSSGRTIM